MMETERRFTPGDLVTPLIVAMIAGPPLIHWGPSGHVVTLLGALITTASAAVIHERYKTAVGVAGAMLAALGGLLSGHQSELHKQEVLLAVEGEKSPPYLAFHFTNSSEGRAQVNYKGRYPIFDVMIQIDDLTAKLKFEKERKSFREIQQSIKVFPLGTMVPGIFKEFPFQFPETQQNVYQILITSRTKFFKQFCKIYRLELWERFSQGCWLIDPIENKVVKKLYSRDFPRGPDGRYIWPIESFFVPPVTDDGAEEVILDLSDR